MNSRLRTAATIAAAFIGCGLVAVGSLVWAEPAAAPAAGPAMDDAHRQQADKLIANGVKYLISQREQDGGWSMGRGANKPAITAMVIKILVQDPTYGPNAPEVKKGIDAMLAFRQKDGGIYEPTQGVANYTTSLAVMALAAVKDPQYKSQLDDAVKYLKNSQIVEGSESPDGAKITKDNPMFGGVTYGKHGRPDLSNMGMWIEALHEAGVSADDPAIQNALTFITRTQNRSESNKQAWAVEGNDGGFVYAPARKGQPDMGESPAGTGEGGKGLRSYGSMTYVGFKSLLYAGLTRQDPRVEAAFNWIRRYWRLDSNPNMPKLQSKQGLYYYYHAFAKALRAFGQNVITDPQGNQHNWRQELIEMLAGQVNPDGSWVNPGAERWEEGNPALVTCYAVMALQETLK